MLQQAHIHVACTPTSQHPNKSVLSRRLLKTRGIDTVPTSFLSPVGRLGDCYFTCALNLLAEYEPQAIARCIRHRPVVGSGGGDTREFDITFQHHVRGKFRNPVTVTTNDVFYSKTLQHELGMHGKLAKNMVTLKDVEEWDLHGDDGGDVSIDRKLEVRHASA